MAAADVRRAVRERTPDHCRAIAAALLRAGARQDIALLPSRPPEEERPASAAVRGSVRARMGPDHKTLLPHRAPSPSRRKRAFGDDRAPASDIGGKGCLRRSRRLARAALGNGSHLSLGIRRGLPLNGKSGHAAMSDINATLA